MTWMQLNTPIRDWRDRRVWIIGASSGIGAALAEALLERGARVALSARSERPLRAASQSWPKAQALAMDVCQPDDWQRAHDSLQATWGGLDLVVFCAATYRPERIWEVRADIALSTLATNVGGVYHGLQVVLPRLLAQGHGGLAILASVAGYTGLPGASVYGPTKAALINLAEGMYSELKPRGLDVYLVNPGFVQTRLTALNEFDMPALLTPAQAALAIVQGFERGRFEIDFPRRFTFALQLLRHLPYALRFALLRRTAQPRSS